MPKNQFWGFVQRFLQKADFDGENDGESVELGVWSVELCGVASRRRI